MEYGFNVEVTPWDFFKMSMKKTYTSVIGVCNLVFLAAMILMTVRFYGEASDGLRCIMLFMCIIIPILQPMGIYLRARNLAHMIPEDMTIETCCSGLMVRVGEAFELVGYEKIKKVICNDDCLILAVGGGNGYFLFNRVLGDRKEAFTKYIKSRMD